MRYTKIIWLFFLIINVSTVAQSNNEIDGKLLEYLVKSKIDAFRISKKIVPLVNDSILYIASNDHSQYLDSKQKITHYQKEAVKKTPQLRAEFYGAINYQVGENIVETPLRGTEESIAEEMVQAWLASPKHYANIVTADYDITGVSVKFNKARNSFICVQKFAIVNEFYVVEDHIKLFPFAGKTPKEVIKNFAKTLPPKHKKHAYKIKEKKKREICRNSNSDVFTNNTIALSKRGDSLYVGFRKRHLSRIKQYFKEKKDGLSLEFVMFDYTYSCNPADNVVVPTRRNGRCEFNGPILKPTYKKEVLKQIKREEAYNRVHRIRLHKDECIWVNLGKFPDKVAREKIEINLLVLKKNRLCKIVSALSVCGRQLLNPLPILPYYNNLYPVTYKPKLKPEIKRIRVNFGKNETQNNSNAIQNAIQDLRRQHHEIIRADVKAFASVEGSLKGNELLFIKRAESVLKQFEEHQDSVIKYKLTTNENWRLFYKQIDTTSLSYLKDLDTLEVRKYVNNANNQKALEPLLSKQRYAFITLYTRPKITNNNLILFAKENFQNIIKANKHTRANVKKLSEIQQFLFNKITTGDLPFDALSLYFPKDHEKLIQLRFNELMFNYTFLKKTSHLMLFIALEKLKKTEHNIEFLNYNARAAFFNSNQITHVADRLKKTIQILPKLKQYGISKDTLNTFELHKNHLRINKYYSHQGGGLTTVLKAAKFVKKHYDLQMDTMSDAFKFKLAQYYVFAGQDFWAMELLKPLSSLPNYKHSVYILYLKVYHHLTIQSPEYSDINILLTNAMDKLTKEEWCDLYIGMCNINFHIFDDQSLKNLYCATCK